MLVNSAGQNGQVKYFHLMNTDFDKGDILTNQKSFMSSMNIPINEENCELSTLYWIPKFQKNQYLDKYIPGSSTCSTKELSITMTKIWVDMSLHSDTLF
jgi:hypothetical protein